MPYTMAAIFELLRYISHVPIGVPRVTTADVTLRGYVIPAKTKVSFRHQMVRVHFILYMAKEYYHRAANRLTCKNTRL